MNIPILRLYDAAGAGLVICCSSGVRISNQTGGTACLQQEVEGVYVPLRVSSEERVILGTSLEDELRGWFTGPTYRDSGATIGIDDADADFIDSVLKRHRLPSLSVDRTRLSDSHEAWIRVVISGDESSDPDLSQFANFAPYPRQGILTWENSD